MTAATRIVSCLALALAACGGGGSPPPPAQPAAPPPLKCATAFSAPGPGPRFQDVTAAWGFADVRGGRVSVGDIDGDGYPDVIVHRTGAGRADLTQPPKSWPYRVMLNRPGTGGGRAFEDHTVASGYGALEGAGANTGRIAHFAVFGDLDDDGDVDIFSGAYIDPDRPENDLGDRTRVLLNDGSGKFTAAPSSDVLAGSESLVTTAATLLDDNRDGHLDVFIGRWYRSYGRSYDGVTDRLAYGFGDGSFTDVTALRGLETPGAGPEMAGAPVPTYGVTACDLDLDGRTDLIVSAYGRRPNKLWMRRAAAFEEMGVASGFAADANADYSDNEFYRCYCQTTGSCSAAAPRIACDALYWGAGVDDQPWRLGGNTFTTVCADIDNDGKPDLYNAEIAHWHIGASSDPSGLLLGAGTNAGVPSFSRPSRQTTGLDVPRVGVTWNEGGIGAGVADLDNDGSPEILLGTSDYPDQYLWVYRRGAAGTFAEVGQAAGLHHPCAPSFAFADLDRDGDLDLIVASSTARDCRNHWADGPEVRIYENLTGQQANWLQVHLEGAGASVGGANRSAIGAVVQVFAGTNTYTREVQGGYGHFGMQHDIDVSVGLGETCVADAVEVRWPDGVGSVERFENVRANYRLVIRQGEGLTYRNAP